jgi:hypothetical protein
MSLPFVYVYGIPDEVKPCHRVKIYLEYFTVYYLVLSWCCADARIIVYHKTWVLLRWVHKLQVTGHLCDCIVYFDIYRAVLCDIFL